MTETVNPNQTGLSNIQFYSGVLLDPTEQMQYVPLPPAGTPAHTPISEWWTRQAFEDEVLTPHLRPDLSIPDSYYQDVTKQILHYAPLEKFQQNNVNFVKVTNVSADGTNKIFYGFVVGSSWGGDGVTLVDWRVSKFYTNLFNGLVFDPANINQCHYQLSTNGQINDTQFNIREAIDIGDDIQPYTSRGESNFAGQNILDIKNDPVRFICIEYNAVGTGNVTNPQTGVVSKQTPRLGGTPISVGLPSSRAYVIIPYNMDSKRVYDIVTPVSLPLNGTGSPDAAYMQSSSNMYDTNANGGMVQEVVNQIMSQEPWQNNGNSIGSVWVTYFCGFTYTISGNNLIIDPTQNGATDPNYNIFAFIDTNTPALDKTYKNYILPVMVGSYQRVGWGKPISVALYGYIQRVLREYLDRYAPGYTGWMDAHGGFPEKLTHYVSLNLLEGDSKLGELNIADCLKPNNPFGSNVYSSPHQGLRNDIEIHPFTDVDDVPQTMGFSPDGPTWKTMFKKNNSQRSSTIPLAISAVQQYSYLNQYGNAQAINNIQSYQNIADETQRFNMSQAQLAAANNLALTKQGNSNNLQMTTQTANQTQGMQQIGIGRDLVGVGASTLGNLATGNFAGALGTAVGGAAQAGFDWTMAGLQRSNTLKNTGLANQQALGMTQLQNSQNLQMVSNSTNFGMMIAAQTAKIQSDTLHAQWKDVGLSPSSTISGGSETEYLAQQGWFYLQIVLGIPMPVGLMRAIYRFMEYGVKVKLFDVPDNYFYTRKVCNYIETLDCVIHNSSSLETLDKLELQAMFNRGVQIWHDLNKMAAKDYTGNDYVNG